SSAKSSGRSRPTSSARCDSCCRTTPGCVRPGCCGWGWSCTDISAGGGLFLYDHIGGRHLLPPTRSVDLTRDEVGQPLMPNRYARGFEYSDCFVDDARLVVLTARDAADRGAEIRTRTRAVEVRQAEGIWHVTVENTETS